LKNIFMFRDEESAPRIPQLRWRDPELIRQRQVLHERINLAVARAYVISDSKAHLRPRVVWPYLKATVPGGYWPTLCRLRYAGAPQAALTRLRNGDLGIEENLGLWTAEFFLGLTLSGGLQEKETGRFRIDTAAHPELAEDIAQWHIAGKLGNDYGFGRRRLVGCLATQLPTKDPVGASVVAGLFAGARLRSIAGECWLELPDNEAVRQLLEKWSIRFSSSQRIRRQDYLNVSPFYAALFADLMPAHSQQRILGIRKPAMCPLLPVLYWDWLYSPLRPGMRILPFADALPFGCSRRTFYRRGWKRDELHWKAVHMGLLSVEQLLRVRLHHWIESHQHTGLVIERSEPITA
jgi:hypothetical protein